MFFYVGQPVRPKDDRHQWRDLAVTLTILAIQPSRVVADAQSLRLRVQWQGREPFVVWQPAGDFEAIP